eukprot:CAMPEP_0178445306 /NCGR_PEP_ID=MMETSP0689_2-20121128/40070_1 /TAXON_ID=160604 /ORGANISM="Amphidinium massartii, Strain CS-259" /LENGTH=156 /DNA_ID=CAMNT_0020069795 /DNA_START=24 /DNA_END=494 /DNA_ORIENTATION=-
MNCQDVGLKPSSRHASGSATDSTCGMPRACTPAIRDSSIPDTSPQSQRIAVSSTCSTRYTADASARNTSGQVSPGQGEPIKQGKICFAMASAVVQPNPTARILASRLNCLLILFLNASRMAVQSITGKAAMANGARKGSRSLIIIMRAPLEKPTKA